MVRMCRYIYILEGGGNIVLYRIWCQEVMRFALGVSRRVFQFDLC